MEKRGIEIVVGIFVLVGLVTAATLVLIVGVEQSSVHDDYRITVAFPSASGIIKGSKVLMSGVHIGKVVSSPSLGEGGDRALIQIGLGKEYQIREGSKFVIRESGLLGDRYVEVQPNSDAKASFIKANETTEGSRTTGIGDLTSDARPVIQKSQEALNRLNQILVKVDEEILDDATKDNLKNAVSKLNSVLNRTDNLLAQAEKGQGLLAKVLTDKRMAQDLRDFIYNLRTRGILWYKDVASQEEDKARH
ncbi:MAG: MlaD family protein [Verrucomicrobiae bacterium]|nr:MlaD family protein [Verrucomicrobiae bacterium]